MTDPRRRVEGDEHLETLIQQGKAVMKSKGYSDDEIAEFERERRMAPTTRDETPGDRLRGLAMSAAQGVTLGFADDALGAIAGAENAVMRGGSYAEGRDRYTSRFRDEQGQFRENHPVASIVAEGAGAMVPAVATLGRSVPRSVAGIATRPTIAQRAARTAKVGAGYGAVAGAGNADGGIAERATGAVMGGTVGAVAGPVLGATLPPLTRAAGRIGMGAVNAVQRGIDRLPPGVPLTRSGGTASRASIAGVNASQRAAELFSDAFERDGVPVESVARRGANPTETPTMLMDMGGRNVIARARDAASIPSRAQEDVPAALWNRQEGQSTRVLRGSSRELARGRDFGGTADEAVTALRTNARPLFERAYAEAPEVPIAARARPDGPSLVALLDRPAANTAYQRAVQLARNEGVEIPDDLAQRAPSLQTLDYMKRGIDDLIAAEELPALTFGGAPRMTNQGRVLTNLRRELVGILDEASPTYRQARAQFAGDREVVVALESGRRVFNVPHRQLERQWGEMSEAEREMFRVGASEAIAEQAGKLRGTGADLTKRIWGPQNSDVRRNVQLMFQGNAQGYRRWRAMIERESTGHRSLQAVTGNSNTASKVAGIGDIAGVNAGELGAAVGNAASGNVGGLFQQLGQRVLRRGVQGMNENVADELGRMGTARAGTQRFSDVIRQLNEIEQMRRAQMISRQRVSAVTGAAAGSSGRR